MAVTSPDNIWTPDNGDDYALTVDLARTADDIQDALNAVRGQSAPRIGTTGRARAGAHLNAQYNSGGAIVQGNSEASVETVTLAGVFPAGSVVSGFTSLEVYQGANATIAGNVRVRLGTVSGPIMAERRWNTHGRAGRLTPSMAFTYVLTSSVTNPQFTVSVNSDPLSGGPVEIWDGQLSIAIDRIG